MRDQLDFGRWVGAKAPALIVEGEPVTFEAVARLGDDGLADAPRSGTISFVANAHLKTLALALAAISRGRPIVPLHPKRTDEDRERLVARIAAVEGQIGADALAILATSGSTGEPKLVELSRHAFIASAEASHRNIPLLPGDRWLLAMPFAHAGGLSILTRCLLAGATVVVHRAFEPRAVLASIERDRVSVLSVVPAMLALLLAEDRANVLAKLKAVLIGGAACAPAHFDECVRRGIPALLTYGLTEACSQVTVQPLARPALRGPSDAGYPLDGTTVEILAEDGSPRAHGVGRIRVRGATIMTHYLGHPETYGVFVTEDLGSFDDRGRLTVVGRVDDMIISGGENVHPLEVERLLSQIEGVEAALVVGVPDPIWGQVVAALVVLRESARLDDVRARASEEIAAHMRPRRWSAALELPLNGTGKPDRRAAVRRLAGDDSSAT